MHKRQEQTFHRKRQMILKHMNTDSTSLTLRETKIKTTPSYNFTPIRLTKFQKLDNTLGENVGKETFSYIAGKSTQRYALGMHNGMEGN